MSVAPIRIAGVRNSGPTSSTPNGSTLRHSGRRNTMCDSLNHVIKNTAPSAATVAGNQRLWLMKWPPIMSIEHASDT